MYNIIHLHQRFCEYSLVFKGNTKSTIVALENSFQTFLKSTEQLNVQRINRQDIVRFIIDGKTMRSWSPKTIRNQLQYLSLFFDWCITEGHLQVNPTKDIPRPKLHKQLPKAISKEAAVTLIEYTQNYPYYYSFERYRSTAIIATFLFTGVRLRELENLTMIDIDIEHTKTLTVRKGKGNKDRIIPINNRLIDILERYLRAREKLQRKTPYFFTALRHDRKMGGSTVKCLIDKLRERSNIYFSAHVLRHTFATLMLEGGCDLFSLSKMMGHSDIKTTSIYLNATTAHLQQQIHKHPLYW